MKNIHGKCLCGAVEGVIKEYGNFVYICHCDNCADRTPDRCCPLTPSSSENVEFLTGEDKITCYPDEEVFRGSVPSATRTCFGISRRTTTTA
ncbi:hypothetical protein FACS1894132_12370 [Clostridia bacterium]|nr:hypothetical protein FACS1894132_12370 [Clostridia bacterium]